MVEGDVNDLEEPMPVPEHIARFILERDLCVLSTSTPEGVPHASLMSYVAEPDLQYIHMATVASSRKWANLTVNPRMAILMDEREMSLSGGRGQARALTIGGAHEPGPAQDKARVLDMLRKKFPHLAGFFARPDLETIRFKPRWFLLLTGAEHSEFIDLKNN